MAIEIKSTAASSSNSSSATSWKDLRLLAKPISAKDRMFFTERLALLLETGHSLHASLETVGHQADNKLMRDLITQLREDIAEGLSFSQALAKHPQVFSTTYVNLVAASEQGGFMSAVLEQIKEMEDKRAQLKATLQSALFYPVFLILFSIGVVAFVLIVVFPKFGDLFSAIADELPVTTRFLMTISDLLRYDWIYLAGGLGALCYLFVRWLKNPKGAATMDRLKLTLPLIREIFVQMYVSQVMRVISLSLSNGVTVLETLRSCHDVVRNRVFGRFIEDVQTHVTEGSGLAIGFQQADFIPDLVKQMVTTGEETGNLPLVTKRIADFYEQELTKKLTMVAKIVEPLMLVVMGLVVGIIVSSLILPIFKLSRVVH